MISCKYDLSKVSLALLFTTSLVCASTSVVFAEPQGGLVVGGAASIEAIGPDTTIRQFSDRAIIRWDSFNVQSHESVNFQQPSASSITVNRIRDSKASQIDGHITANGNILLLNPNGIIFGAGSRVDVGGLVASTSDLKDDADFMAGGHVKLTQPGNYDSKIKNHGVIKTAPGGLAGFVAPNVENSGIIEARLGKIALASGDMATVDFAGDSLIQVVVSDDIQKQLIKNTGTLSADGGSVIMTAAAARDVVNSLIEVSGNVSARSVGNKRGEIDISAEGGNRTEGNESITSTVIIKDAVLDVSGRNVGERGGKLSVMGDNIALLDSTLIDASGHTGLSRTTNNKMVSDYRDGSAGGDIRIGGDYLGQGNTPTANNLYVGSGAVILNDSLYQGDAGRTIFWSDNTTQFKGKVYARALGTNGGNGGFVETSGKQTLVSNGNVDASASNGTAGTWLLDPSDVTISSGGGADMNASSAAGTWTPTVGASTSTIFVNNINTAMTGGTSVVINTGSTGGGSGDITLGAGANISTGTVASLTLNATRNILLTGNISLGTGTLTLNATGGNISGTGNIASSGSRVFNVGSGSGTYSGIVSGTGSLTKSGTGTLTLTGSNTYTGATNVNAGILVVSGQPYFNIGRTTTITSGATLQLLNSNNSFNTQMPLSTILGAGTLQFLGNSSLSQSSGGVPNQNRLVMSMGVGGLLDLQGTSAIRNGGWQNINWTSNLGSLNIASGASLDVWDGNTIRIDALTGSGTINKGNGGTVNLTLGVNGGSGTFSGTIANSLGTITLTKIGAGSQTLSGNNSYTGTTTISAGTLQIGNSGTTGTLGTGAVTNNAALIINRSDAITISNVISGTGSLTKLGGGITTLTGANTYSGGTNVNAGTLQVGNGGTTGSLGSGAIVNNSNLTYLFAGTSAIGTPTNYSGTGNLSLTAGQVFYPTNLTVGGNLTINSTTSANRLGLQANINPVLTVGGTTSISGFLAGRDNGNNTLTLNSTGAVTLNNIVNGLIGNFWEWETLNINAGTSAINITGSSVMVQNTFNSIWNLTGAVSITGNIAGTGGGIQTLNINDTGNSSISGVLSSTIGLTKSGLNTLTLSGTNTYTGTTNVNAGTLALGANNVLANTSALSVASGAIFNLAGFTETISSLTSVSGSTVTLGNGSLTTSGAQSYGGQVTGGNVSLASTGGGAITANNTANDFTGTVNISTSGAVSLVDANSLTLGTISGSTISAQTIDSAADIILGGNFNASATSGDSIILAAGRDIDNSSNRALTTAGAARWQIYSGDTSNGTQSLGGLTGFTRLGCTYNAGVPNCAAGTDIPAAGNGFYYAFTPSISITPPNLIPPTVQQAINNTQLESVVPVITQDSYFTPNDQTNNLSEGEIIVVPDDDINSYVSSNNALIVVTESLKNYFSFMKK